MSRMPMRGLLSPGWMRAGRGGAAGVVYGTRLLEDNFTTNLAAGSVDGTATEPAGGLRTVNDTGNWLYLDGGWVKTTGGGSLYGNPGITIGLDVGSVFTLITPTPGQVLVMWTAWSAANLRLGLCHQQSPINMAYLWWQTNGGIGPNVGGYCDTGNYSAWYANDGASMSAGQAIRVAVLLVEAFSGVGVTPLWLIQVGAGNDWIVSMPSIQERTGDYCFGWDNYNTAFSDAMDRIVVHELSGGATSFPKDFGCDYYSATADAGDKGTAEADAWFVFKTPSNSPYSSNVAFYFRMPDNTDTNNGWSLEIDNPTAGSGLLREWNSGTPTTRAASSTTTEYRNVAIFAGSDRICVYRSYSACKLLSYNSATAHQTETGWRLDAVDDPNQVTHLRVYPMTLTLPWTSEVLT